MKDIIKRNLNGWKVLLLFLLANVLYVIMLTVTIPKVMSLSGGLKILDMMPTGYNQDYVNNLMSTLGEKGRNTYLFNQLPVDMVYPLFFGISSCLLLAYLLKKLRKSESPLFYLCYIPLFAGFFDYCENFGIISILNSYPHNSDLLTHLTSTFSVLKSSFTVTYFLILITLLIIIGIVYFLKKNER